MKKRGLLFKTVTISLVTLVVFGQEPLVSKTREEQMAEDLCWLSLKEPVPSLEGVDKAEVIRILRDIEDLKISRIGRTIVSSRSAQIALLRIGDDQTLRETVDSFRRYDSRYALAAIPKAIEYAHPPKMIPLLAEDFFREEDPKEFISSRTGQGSMDATIVASPLSIYAGVISLKIIEKEPAFSPELRRWATEMIDLRYKDVETFRSTMRGWWLANQQHFASGDYHRVTSEVAPMVEQPKTPPPALPQLPPVPDILPQQDQPVVGQPKAVGEYSKKESSAHSTPVAETAKVGLGRWIVGATVLAIFILVFLLRFVKRVN